MQLAHSKFIITDIIHIYLQLVITKVRVFNMQLYEK